MFPRPRPRTWTACAAKSTLTKRNVVCLAAALSASAIPGASTAELMARRHAPINCQSYGSLSHTFPTPRKGTHSPLPLPTPCSQDLRHGTSHRPSRCLKTACPDQSRQSSPPTICVRVSIDERRHQVVCTTCRPNTSNRRWKRFLEMYFVRFIQCPSAVTGGGGNQRLVSEGTAITQREIRERDGGGCEGD